ncbi:MAG: TetR family transcriptional regulator [Peptococcaceae bacterium BRH_c4b]|nr:MAG: TetR family transcriptional regulator [Peptococcaceae bacterium BRH_c4b]
MNEEKSNRRSYTSPLRRNQQEITRNRIMEAVAAIISEGRILSFSVKDVAERAGISYGSVYRHFPTRESLLEALYEMATKIAGQGISLTSLSLDEIPAVVGKTVALFEENAVLSQAFTMALAAGNIQPQSRCQRDQKYQQMVTESAHHLDPEAVRQIAAIICHLYSSLTWATLRQRFELSAEATADALTWALQALIRDLTRHKED